MGRLTGKRTRQSSEGVLEVEKDSVIAAVEGAILRETSHRGGITLEMTSSEIDGYDSLAHVRIIFRVDRELGTRVDIKETYSAKTIGDLVDIFLSEV